MSPRQDPREVSSAGLPGPNSTPAVDRRSHRRDVRAGAAGNLADRPAFDGAVTTSPAADHRALGRLQTSPYLTVLSPGEPAPIRYLTDTFGPAVPDTDGPVDASFGLVGLDRSVMWESDARVLSLLMRCAREPVSAAVLSGEFGAEMVLRCQLLGWLQEPRQLCREYRLVSGEIEVTAHCNWGCRFCPVSTDPKPRQTMAMDVFEEIVAKLTDVGTVDYVTFHFFNEPTLDTFFAQRLDVLADYGMPLALYTNASGLNAAKLEALTGSGVLRHLIVNLPSADPAAFEAMTGSRAHARTITHVEAAARAGLPTTIVVNGTGQQQEASRAHLQERFGRLGAEVVSTLTCDRAGDVGGDYHQNIHVTGRLTGCGWPVSHANFSVTGDLFLCCNDYHQRETFGNIQDGSIDALMTSPAAVALRQKVFGVSDAADDFICRRCHNQTPDFPDRQFLPLAALNTTAPAKRRRGL